jgi:hypothetical protein
MHAKSGPPKKVARERYNYGTFQHVRIKCRPKLHIITSNEVGDTLVLVLSAAGNCLVCGGYRPQL